MRIYIAIWLTAGCLAAQERATITGNVTDATGKPVEHTTVMVYEAGVKKGYSIFCPTCYTDCGKRAVTDAGGNFSISGLSPDLWFTLLVIRDGFTAVYVKKVDPEKGPTEAVVLKPRLPVEDVSQVVRGRVVSGRGNPVRDAVVEQHGVTFKGPDGRMGTRFGGAKDWMDQIAVTNEKGEFEVAFSRPAVQMILQVQPRGMAAKLFTEPTGGERKTMTVTDGATIRGRLVHEGKPVANAQVGLTTHDRRAGTNYAEIRIGTKEDGTFAITNVPAGRIWLVYPKMESLAARGIGADPVACETKDDGQEVDLGDILLKPAYTLRGRVALSDGKPVPPDMRVTLSADRAWDSQVTVIGEDGRFEFHGLVPGVYGIAAAVKGYHPGGQFAGEALVNRDVNDLVIRMEPGTGRP